ncbi:MAG TPA: AAA family ATPase [Firmicutes bacterium]|nr:AAA family ATPase [Bacillota bacterium]
MIIRRLIMTGFGRFHNKILDFQDGLNVVFGPNESGKTTIQQFIKGMLYGFKKPDAKRREWTEEQQRYEPWAGGQYRGSLEFVDEEGRAFRVERSFARSGDGVRLLDAVTGKDLSSSYPTDRRKELMFAEDFTGMNQLVFAGTVFIGDIPGGGDEVGRKELAARLANLQETGDEAVSLRLAAGKLDKCRKEQVRIKNQAGERLAKARQLLEEIGKYREAIRKLEEEQAGLVEKRRLVASRLNEVNRDLLAEEAEQLSGKLTAWKEAGQMIEQWRKEAAELALYAAFPLELKEVEAELLVRLKEVENNRQQAGERVEKLRLALVKVKEEYQKLPGASEIRDEEAASAWEKSGQSIALQLAQMEAQLREAEERLAAETRRCKELENMLLQFAPLTVLPEQTPQLVDNIVALREAAGELLGSLSRCLERTRMLKERIQGYMTDVARLLRQLQELKEMAELPPNSQARLQEHLTQAKSLTQTARQLWAAGKTDREKARQARERLQQLQPVIAAGQELLAEAEALLDQEGQARLRAEAAEAEVEAIPAPPKGGFIAGGALIAAGILLAIWLVMAKPAFWWWLPPLAAFVVGAVQVAKARRVVAAIEREKQKWYDTKSQCRATVTKLNSRIQDLLAKVRQPSVPAWREAWRDIAACRADVEKEEALTAAINQLLEQRKEHEAIVLDLLQKAGCLDQDQDGSQDGQYERQPAVSDGVEPEPDSLELPWTENHIARFMEKAARYADLLWQRQHLPERLANLPSDLEQVAGDVAQFEASYTSWRQKWAKVVIFPLEQTAATPEALWRQAWVEAAAATGLAETEETTQREAGDSDNYLHSALEADIHPALYYRAQELPPDLWPEECRQAAAALPSTVQLEKRHQEVLGVIAAAEQLLSSLLAAAGAGDVGQLHSLWDERQRLIAQAGQQAEKTSAAEEAYQRLLADMRRFVADQAGPFMQKLHLLIPVGAEKTGLKDINAWLNGINEGLDHIRRCRRMLQQVADISKELELEEETSRRHEAAMAKLQQELAEVYMKAGVGDAQEFAAACRNKAAYVKLMESIEQKEAEIAGILSGSTGEELAERYKAVVARWQELRQEFSEEENGSAAMPADLSPSPPPAGFSRSAAEAQRAELQAALAGLHDRITEINSEMKMYMAQCEPEEEAVAEEEEAAGIYEAAGKAIAALELALTELENAAEEVHRQFAPRLNEKASRILYRLTNGRYDRLSVDDSLTLSVIDPDLQRSLNASAVSRGTYDQIYLAFRLAAADVICEDKWRPPLLLDDVFAHSDDERTREGLSTLLFLAEDRQIIFFTCRRRELHMLTDLQKETGRKYHEIVL